MTATVTEVIKWFLLEMVWFLKDYMNKIAIPENKLCLGYGQRLRKHEFFRRVWYTWIMRESIHYSCLGKLQRIHHFKTKFEQLING